MNDKPHQIVQKKGFKKKPMNPINVIETKLEDGEAVKGLEND